MTHAELSTKKLDELQGYLSLKNWDVRSEKGVFDNGAQKDYVHLSIGDFGRLAGVFELNFVTRSTEEMLATLRDYFEEITFDDFTELRTLALENDTVLSFALLTHKVEMERLWDALQNDVLNILED